MMRRSNWIVLGASALAGALLIVSGVGGCQAQQTSPRPDDDDDSSGGNGTTSSGTTTSASGSTGQGGATSMSSGSGSTAGGGGEGQGGGNSGCVQDVDATVQDVAKGTFKQKEMVRLKGVVATSRKFLVSQSNSSGSCLWGMFVSAPNLPSTAEYSGVLVVSYGNDAVIPPGGDKAFCPKLGEEPLGDAIPDDVKPGDELTIIGEASSYAPSSCASSRQWQIAFTCQVERTSTGLPVPTPHVIPAADAPKLGMDDPDFNAKWAGVKVRLEGVTAVQQAKDPNSNPPDMTPVIVNKYGEIKLKDSNVTIGDKLYYLGYLAKSDACHAGPVFTPDANGEVVLTAVEGFSYHNFCTWGLQAENKCKSFEPPSEDCDDGGPGGSPLACE